MAIRKTKEDKPVLAICYDFDKTLSPDDMQAQGYIQAVYDGDVETFWKECNALATENDMDSNLAYMYKMVDEAQGRLVFTKKTLADYGAKVELFPGVEEWFERIRAFGAEHGVIVEHYIISSGLKEMIEGTPIAKAGAFEKIYASSFMFDKKGVAVENCGYYKLDDDIMEIIKKLSGHECNLDMYNVETLLYHEWY